MTGKTDNSETPRTYKCGTYTSYTKGKCRCAKCRKAASNYLREYRKTAKGNSARRFYHAVTVQRSLLAAKWIKTNMPNIWDEITEEARAITASKPAYKDDIKTLWGKDNKKGSKSK